jgi:hypothetical protein
MLLALCAIAFPILFFPGPQRAKLILISRLFTGPVSRRTSRHSHHLYRQRTRDLAQSPGDATMSSFAGSISADGILWTVDPAVVGYRVDSRARNSIDRMIAAVAPTAAKSTTRYLCTLDQIPFRMTSPQSVERQGIAKAIQSPAPSISYHRYGRQKEARRLRVIFINRAIALSSLMYASEFTGDGPRRSGRHQ